MTEYASGGSVSALTPYDYGVAAMLSMGCTVWPESRPQPDFVLLAVAAIIGTRVTH